MVGALGYDNVYPELVPKMRRRSMREALAYWGDDASRFRNHNAANPQGWEVEVERVHRICKSGWNGGSRCVTTTTMLTERAT